MIHVKRNLFTTLTSLLLASASHALVVQQEEPIFAPNFPQLNPLGTTPSSAVLSAALEALNAGRLEEALRLAQDELARQPQSAPAHELLGVVWALQGDLTKARKALEQAVALDFRQWTALVKLGDLDLAQGDRAAAKKHFQAASAQGGEDPQLQQRFGLMAFYDGRFNEAEAFLKKGIAGLAPDSVSVRPYLAFIYNQRAQYAQALSVFQGVPLQKVKDAQAYIAVATAMAGLERNQEAKTLLDDARKQFARHPGVWLLSGRLMRQMGLFPDAIPVLSQAVQLSPSNKMAAMDLALAEIGGGDTAGGLARAQALAKAAPKNLLLQAGLAQAYAQAKQPEKAITAYRPLLAVAQTRRSAALGLSRQLMITTRYKEAQAVLEKAHANDPNDAELLQMLGSVQATQGQYAPAVQSYRKALQINPAQPEVLQLLSVAQARTGDVAGALQTAQKLADVEPGNPQALLFLAIQQEGAGQPDKAQSNYEAVLRQDPKSRVALNNLALILLERGQAGRALDLAVQLLPFAANDPQLLDTVGWIYLKNHRAAEGRKVLEQALALGNAGPNVWYHYAVLLSG
ncbi:tetratricopeptide repeat protein, partial [Rhodoferax sp. 4810]|nr:tetratricopeptide repeat protein [Rhodoferax jenense]